MPQLAELSSKKEVHVYPPQHICSDLRQMANHYRKILKIILWSQLIAAFVSVLFAIYFGVKVVEASATNQPQGPDIYVRSGLMVIGFIGGSATYGVLGMLGRSRNKDFKQTREEMLLYCKEARGEAELITVGMSQE